MIGSVIQRGSVFFVYDERNHQISSRALSSSAELRGYTGSSFSVMNNHVLSIYDEHCHLISSRAVGR